MIEGKRSRWKPTKRWRDNISHWTGLNLMSLNPAVKDRNLWRQISHVDAQPAEGGESERRWSIWELTHNKLRANFIFEPVPSSVLKRVFTRLAWSGFLLRNNIYKVIQCDIHQAEKILPLSGFHCILIVELIFHIWCWFTFRRYKSKYTLEEVAVQLLKTSHVICVSDPEGDPKSEENIRESDACEVLKRKLTSESNLNLAIGAIIANEMRDAVFEKTRFTCSAGIAHNKVRWNRYCMKLLLLLVK